MCLTLIFVAVLSAAVMAEKPTFRVKKIDNYRVECCGVGDFNNDGHLDIVAGQYIYYGPDWRKVQFREVASDIDEEGNGYAWDFMDTPLDVDGDGYLDIVTLSWHGQKVEWLKNPGKNGKEGDMWEKFTVMENGPYEMGDLWDISGDGKANDMLPNPLQTYWFSLEKKEDGTQGLVKHLVSDEEITYGSGVGDVNGDGRNDILRPGAWFEAPEDPKNGEWIRHPLSVGGADGATDHTPQILVYDVNGDGRNDIITSSAHGYGIYWYEQLEGEDQWKQHVIDKSWSQAHALTLVDLDGDGQMELVAGKRFRAHNGHDPGATEPLCVYWYKIKKDADGNVTWERNTITEGEGIGAGMVIHAVDINGDGKIDLVTVGKYGGPVIFENVTE